MVRPGRLAEQRGHLPAQLQGLVQQRPVRGAGLVPVLDEQLAAQVAVVRLLEEWVDLGVVEADPIRPLPLPGREALDVVVGQPRQLLAGHVDAVAELVDVALEGDLDLDEPRAEPLQLGAVLGAQLVAGTAEVAQPVGEQPGPLAFERFRLVGVGEGAHGPIQVVAEDERHAPLVDALFGIVAGVAHGGIGMDLAHEAGSAVGFHQRGRGKLERLERGVEGGGVGRGRPRARRAHRLRPGRHRSPSGRSRPIRSCSRTASAASYAVVGEPSWLSFTPASDLICAARRHDFTSGG